MISIFAKPASYMRTKMLPVPHIIRGSSMIRGEQIAERLGCRLNPESGYENDICVHVKPTSLDNIKAGDWVDAMDASYIVNWLYEKPEINVIAFSDCTYADYRRRIHNKMTVIPQHHCNFDRELRNRKDVTVAGFIGGEIGFSLTEAEMRSHVEKAGMKFLFCSDYRTREDVVDFYRQIDVQITWSAPKYKLQAKAPLKVTNAASFGIPTVGYHQVCYEEVGGCYLGVSSIESLIDMLRCIQNKEFYQKWSDKALSIAERYHIDRIADLYRSLQ